MEDGCRCRRRRRRRRRRRGGGGGVRRCHSSCTCPSVRTLSALPCARAADNAIHICATFAYYHFIYIILGR